MNDIPTLRISGEHLSLVSDIVGFLWSMPYHDCATYSFDELRSAWADHIEANASEEMPADADVDDVIYAFAQALNEDPDGVFELRVDNAGERISVYRSRRLPQTGRYASPPASSVIDWKARGVRQRVFRDSERADREVRRKAF